MIHPRNVRNGNTGIQISSIHLNPVTDVHITKEATQVMEPVMETKMAMKNPYQDSKYGSFFLLCCLLFLSDENLTFD